MLCLRVGVKDDRFICIMFHSFLVLLREFISTFTFIFVFRYSELHCYIMNGRTMPMNTLYFRYRGRIVLYVLYYCLWEILIGQGSFSLFDQGGTLT